MDKKTVTLGDKEVNLIVWDLAGEDEFQKVSMDYLRGAAGYLLVADGTRLSTLETARMLRQRVADNVGEIPFAFIVNKNDLSAEWEIDDQAIADCQAAGWAVIRSSAKTGEGVEEAFKLLAEKICGT